MSKRQIWYATIAVTGLLGLVISVVLTTDKLYTHLFYIPIALTAVFYPKSTLMIGVIFGLYHIFLEWLLRSMVEYTVALRAVLITIISIILSQIGALDRMYKQQIDSLSYKSNHDALTGLYNRGHFDSVLDDDLVMPVAVFICDIDNLKKTNDTYGHEKGDQSIIETARILCQSIRQKDTLARLGGDEFGIIAPECDDEEAERIYLRIQKALNEFNGQMPEMQKLSFSLGYKVCHVRPQLKEVLKSADVAMYEVKVSKKKNNVNLHYKTKSQERMNEHK